MVGMVQSLNVSVACSVVLYEAQRQRQLAGMYERATISEQVRQKFCLKAATLFLLKPASVKVYLTHTLLKMVKLKPQMTGGKKCK